MCELLARDVVFARATRRDDERLWLCIGGRFVGARRAQLANRIRSQRKQRLPRVGIAIQGIAGDEAARITQVDLALAVGHELPCARRASRRGAARIREIPHLEQGACHVRIARGNGALREQVVLLDEDFGTRGDRSVGDVVLVHVAGRVRGVVQPADLPAGDLATVDGRIMRVARPGNRARLLADEIRSHADLVDLRVPALVEHEGSARVACRVAIPVRVDTVGDAFHGVDRIAVRDAGICGSLVHLDGAVRVVGRARGYGLATSAVDEVGLEVRGNLARMAQRDASEGPLVDDAAIVHVESRHVPLDPIPEVVSRAIAGLVEIRAIGVGKKDVRRQVVVVI